MLSPEADRIITEVVLTFWMIYWAFGVIITTGLIALLWYHRGKAAKDSSYAQYLPEYVVSLTPSHGGLHLRLLAFLALVPLWPWTVGDATGLLILAASTRRRR